MLLKLRKKEGFREGETNLAIVFHHAKADLTNGLVLKAHSVPKRSAATKLHVPWQGQPT